jgi:hypothetical protein
MTVENQSSFLDSAGLKENAISKRAKKMEKNEQTKNLPEKKFRAGAISATVWLNSGQSKTGEEVSYRTISLERGYKDKNDVWQSTNSMRVNDLPKVQVLLGKAYEYVILNQSQAAEA